MIRILFILSTLATACVADDPFAVNPRDPSAGGPKMIEPGDETHITGIPTSRHQRLSFCYAELACESVSCVSTDDGPSHCFCMDDVQPEACLFDPEAP